MDECTSEKKFEVVKFIIIIFFIVAVLVLVAIYLLNQMIGFTADSDLEKLNYNAKNVWQYADKYIANNNVEDNFVIYGYEPRNTNPTYYWAVVLENGKIKYTLFSYDKIEINEVKVPDKELQIKMLSNVFTTDNAIGYYSPNT